MLIIFSAGEFRIARKHDFEDQLLQGKVNLAFAIPSWWVWECWSSLRERWELQDTVIGNNRFLHKMTGLHLRAKQGSSKIKRDLDLSEQRKRESGFSWHFHRIFDNTLSFAVSSSKLFLTNTSRIVTFWTRQYTTTTTIDTPRLNDLSWALCHKPSCNWSCTQSYKIPES